MLSFWYSFFYLFLSFTLDTPYSTLYNNIYVGYSNSPLFICEKITTLAKRHEQSYGSCISFTLSLFLPLHINSIFSFTLTFRFVILVRPMREARVTMLQLLLRFFPSGIFAIVCFKITCLKMMQNYNCAVFYYEIQVSISSYIKSIILYYIQTQSH